MMTPPVTNGLQASMGMLQVVMLLDVQQLRMGQTPPPGPLPELLQAFSQVPRHSYTVGARAQTFEDVNGIFHNAQLFRAESGLRRRTRPRRVPGISRLPSRSMFSNPAVSDRIPLEAGRGGANLQSAV